MNKYLYHGGGWDRILAIISLPKVTGSKRTMPDPYMLLAAIDLNVESSQACTTSSTTAIYSNKIIY